MFRNIRQIQKFSTIKVARSFHEPVRTFHDFHTCQFLSWFIRFQIERQRRFLFIRDFDTASQLGHFTHPQSFDASFVNFVEISTCVDSRNATKFYEYEKGGNFKLIHQSKLYKFHILLQLWHHWTISNIWSDCLFYFMLGIWKELML